MKKQRLEIHPGRQESLGCPRGSGRDRAAFTLIEMVGVLAVVLILASVVFSTTVRQVTLIAGQQESTNLQGYATALQHSALRNRYVPGATDWDAVIAAELGLARSTVSTNACGWPRVFLSDPNLQIGLNGNGTLPYAQTNFPNGSVVTNAAGVIPPVNPRLVIVSSLGPPLPSLTSADFTALWNVADGAKPAVSPWTTWTGSGDDLRIQRINLSPLFVRLTLSNCFPTNRVALDTITNFVTGNLDGYFLQSTVVGLWLGTNLLDSEQVLAADTSFVCQPPVPAGTNSEWGLTGDALGQTAAWFASSPANGQAPANPPTQVMGAMTNYMQAYVNWANAGFPSSGSTYSAVNTAQNQMHSSMQNLVQNVSSGNCD